MQEPRTHAQRAVRPEMEEMEEMEDGEGTVDGVAVLARPTTYSENWSLKRRLRAARADCRLIKMVIVFPDLVRKR